MYVFVCVCKCTPARNGRRQTGGRARLCTRERARARLRIWRTTICVNARVRTNGPGIVRQRRLYPARRRAVLGIGIARRRRGSRRRPSIGRRNAAAPAAETRNQIKRAKTFANLFIYARRHPRRVRPARVRACVHDGQITRAQRMEGELWPPQPRAPQGTCTRVCVWYVKCDRELEMPIQGARGSENICVRTNLLQMD